MENKKVYFRHILLFFFQKGLEAMEAQREICDMYGDSASPSADTCQRWFARFRSVDINLADAARSGPSTTDDDQILAAIKMDRYLTTRDITERFNIVHTTISQRLKLGMTKKADVWVPHELTKKNILDRVMICESLLTLNSLESFLKVVT